MADTAFVSLYRRFRPGRFDEIRGQDHVVRALRSAVRDDRVSHAYLFSGPRGTGKTSSARILAKALNCEAPVDGEPCGTCTSCVEITQGNSLNVHELDAASNNGVDAMRDLVAHASLGTPGRWKVYIVDEVHMLSTAAANALLKTLEEPPSHVVFVLATTDPQKVPPTIRSRTQHLEFRLLGSETLHGLLESVNADAGLNLDEEALEAAVRRGTGFGPRRAFGPGPGRRGGVRRRRPARVGGGAERPGRRRREPGVGRPRARCWLAAGAPSSWRPSSSTTCVRSSSPRWLPSCARCPDRRWSASGRWPRRWDWPGSCAAWRSWATRWSTCVRRPTRRSCSRSRSCEPCGPTWTRAWRHCPSG